MIRDQIMQLAQSDPRFSQAIDIAEQQVAHMPIVPKDLEKAIQLLEFVLQNPDKYAEVRNAAVKDGLVPPNMVPEQFDPVFVISLLVALYGLQDRLQQRGYARGGLKVAGRDLAAQGRGGDTMLAHINPREAEMLRRMGGTGTINPNTGLVEYKGGGFLGTILGVALSFIAPGLGTAIGTALGASGSAASMLGGALLGGGLSAATGGNPLLGALTGGLMPVASNALFGESGLGGALGLSGTGTSGNTGILGNIFGAAAPEGVPGAGEAMAPTTNTGGWGASPEPGFQAPEVAPTPVARPEGLTGIAVSQASPSTSVIDSLKNTFGFGTETADTGLTGAMKSALSSPSNITAEAALNNVNPQDALASAGVSGSGSSGSGLNLGSLAKLAPLALAMNSMNQQKVPQQVAASMTPEQAAYFNKPGISWDWNAIEKAANEQGKSVADYLSQNWNDVTSGKFNTGAANSVVTASHGGALNQISRLARGSGSGRDDTINARLSDGEYVMDAETVALLGDGSTDAGAKRLDQMRAQLRKQKGKALSKGKFSPNAKSPLAYLKGVA